ncbi:MAG: OB-fold-containig protein, partial [Opitutales bacterium]
SFAVFLFAFGAVGLLGQYALAEAGLSLLPLALASPLAFLLALPLVRWSNTGLARILPRDESAAVSDETFIGRVATITIGRVTSERQSEARLTGPKGRVHYIQVVADDEGAAFQQGDEVLVVGRRGTLFTVIAVTLANLHDA